MSFSMVPRAGVAGAFSIEEARLAMRWAEMVGHECVRVGIRTDREEADEVIEVHLGRQASPAFSLARLGEGVELTDVLGMTSRFATLTEALVALTPANRLDRSALMPGGCPPWLLAIDPMFRGVPGGGPSFIARFGQRLAAVWRRLARPLVPAALIAGTVCTPGHARAIWTGSEPVEVCVAWPNDVAIDQQPSAAYHRRAKSAAVSKLSARVPGPPGRR